METLWQDLKYGARQLLRSPGFTAVAVLTLALGIGATTTMFSIVHNVLLRPLPYPDPDRIVWFFERQPNLEHAPFSGADYLDLAQQNRTFEHIVAMRNLDFHLTGLEEPERVRGVVATPNMLGVFGTQPAHGRGFLPADGAPGAPRVALLSHGLWQRRFGGDPGVVGREITLNEESVTVVGVLPPSFRLGGGADLYLNPRHVVPEVFATSTGDPTQNRATHYLTVAGKLKPGVSLAQAQADIDAVIARIEEQHRTGHTAHVFPLHEVVVGDVRRPLLILLGAVGLVLLIACANVANLLLARATARQREIALRAALGAGRGRLVRQLLTESLLLAMAGCALGLLLAWWGIAALVAASPPQLPRVSAIQVDRVALAFAVAVGALTGLLFGLAPALQNTRTHLAEALKEGVRGAGGGLPHNRLRRGLIVAEMALSVTLLVGAGLLTRSLLRLLDVDPGFRPENLVTMTISFSSAKYSQEGRNRAFVEELLPRLESLPGVEGVAAANDLPLEGQDTTTYPTVEGREPAQPGEQLIIGVHSVNNNYFRTLGVQLRQGRFFDHRDASSAPRVVIVNQTAAQRLWPQDNAIGKRIRLLGWEGFAEVVGVVGDIKHNGLSAPPSMDAYLPYGQSPWSHLRLTLRTSIDHAVVLSAVRAEVRALDADMPVFAVRPFQQVLDETLGERRLTLLTLGLFAGLSVVLAAVGLYGVMAFMVTQRTREIGVRLALGARRSDILRLVVGQGTRLALVGVGFGLIGGLALTRFLASLLFGISTTDPATFAVVAGLLLGVALLASYLPARRAMRVDPMVALRYE
ncbi:MAG: ABC transporter permease [Candidatus Acidiferrales bacterium]